MIISCGITRWINRIDPVRLPVKQTSSEPLRSDARGFALAPVAMRIGFRWPETSRRSRKKTDYERINLLSTQTMKEMHDWTRAMDVTWALVWLITVLLFVLAPLYVPA